MTKNPRQHIILKDAEKCHAPAPPYLHLQKGICEMPEKLPGSAAGKARPDDILPETIIVAGGDLRFVSLAQMLAQRRRVYAIGFDRSVIPDEKIILTDVMNIPERADMLILPMPVSEDGVTLCCPFYTGAADLSALAGRVKENGKVFGGRVTDKVREIFSQAGFDITDYFLREELSVLNARATAEGALQIALEEQSTVISGQKILILGMGRIARSLIKVLSGFGADITVCARKYSDLAWAEVEGCRSVHMSMLKGSPALSEAELIFNTVPHRILTEAELKCCRSDVLIIDLASKPGGMDMEAAGRLGLRAIWALSLPGKTAPVTSGRIIGETIENILREQSCCG